MKITFPHMGYLYVAIAAALEELGIETVIPPKTGERALALGVRHSPESACFPLKLCVGNLLEAIEAGADSVLMAGGSGPCRFGYYAQVQKQIVEQMGYDVRFHILEPPQTHALELCASLKTLLEKRIHRIPGAIRMFLAKAQACDSLVRSSLRLRAHERNRGAVSRWLGAGVRSIHLANSHNAVNRALTAAMEETDGLCVPVAHRKNTIRIGIVGEIFMMTDDFANRFLEEKLGNLGAEVERKLFITDWVRTHLVQVPFMPDSRLEALSTAKPYLNHFVGGHGLESVGHSAQARSEGLDGIIHLLPFSCMPEIVARSVLPAVSRDKSIPIMSLSLDEHTADTGLLTRLEAFCELIRTKKEEAV